MSLANKRVLNLGRSLLKRRDCDLRRMESSMERRVKAVELWRSGLSIIDISGAMGMHYKTIRD